MSLTPLQPQLMPFDPGFEGRPGRTATFDASEHTMRPRLDPVDTERRLERTEPRYMLPAYLEGRAVALVRPEYATGPTHLPVDYTVPYTMSRLRRESDLERGYQSIYFPSAIQGPPDSGSCVLAFGVGMVVGATMLWTIASILYESR